MTKKIVAILVGGASSEHEVSCVSGTTVMRNREKDRYEALLIGITKDGRWLKVDSPEDIESGKWIESDTTAVLSPDTLHNGILYIKGNDVIVKKVDVVFPVLHGLYGEDGTVQGLLELSRIPYVGCGVLSSAVSMDKLSTKIMVDRLGVRQAQYVGILIRVWMRPDAVIAQC